MTTPNYEPILPLSREALLPMVPQYTIQLGGCVAISTYLTTPEVRHPARGPGVARHGHDDVLDPRHGARIQGPAHIARHPIGHHLAQQTRDRNEWNDLADIARHKIGCQLAQ
jgi:hypothetical protein